jgi:hypothetical protein
MWNSKWKAISARILSLLDAGAFLLRTTEADKSDQCGVAWYLSRNADEVVADLQKLRNGASLPDTLRESLERFLKEYDSCFGSGKPNRPSKFTELGGVLPVLASFRAEFEYLLADTEIVGRSLSVRAFTHLQRSIVADEAVRERWQKAFEIGETACEGLGACHLLSHGIWAFKTSAMGERTDLVLGTPLAVEDDVRRAASALVLTEWKLVREKGELSEKINEAYLQAKRYSEGILAGFELASRRNLVLVSRDHLPMPNERREAEAIYEYRNLAVSPHSPSTGSSRRNPSTHDQ